MFSARRQLLSIVFQDEFDIISENSYTGKYFYCTCVLNGAPVAGTWSLTSGGTYATINANGRVDINEGVENQQLIVRCDYRNNIASKSIMVSYDNQLVIECADVISGTSGNAIARYNSNVVSPQWSITSGNQYATIDALGTITIVDSGVITLSATYNNYTTTKNVTVAYVANTESTTTVNEDGSVTTETTTTTTDPETGAVTEQTTSQTVNEDGSTSTTTEETTTNQDGSSSSTSTTTNLDGSSSTTESSTTAPDPQTGSTTTTSETTNYDENGDVSSSSDYTSTQNTDGSSTSQTNNYDANGDPTTTTNNEVDTSGNSSTQEIEYDNQGDPIVTEYTIDTSGSGGEGKQIEDGVNTEYYAFDVTRGFILDIDFIIDFNNQPPDQNQGHHQILSAKRASPSPWYGFQLRQSNNNRYIQLGTQFATGSNTNTRIDPVTMTNYTAEYILRIVYDPTAATNNFICTDMRTGNTVFTASNVFPDIPDLRYLKVLLGYGVDENEEPFRYSNINVQNFSIVKLAAIYAPVIHCTGRHVTITCDEPGATIYYRINETGDFIQYTSQITLSTDIIVEAYSELNGIRSITVSETCIYTGLSAPTIACDGEIITLSCSTANASIYYRLDQTGVFTVYNAPLVMVADTYVETYSELDGDVSATITATCIYNPSHDYSEDYLTFKVLSDGTIAWQAFGSGYTRTIYYSKNEGAWTAITAAKTTPPVISVVTGDEVRFKGTNTTYAGSKSNYDGFEGGSATFDIEGNIMSLYAGDNFTTATSLSGTYNFCSLFKKSKVVSAEHLVLPVMTLTNYCYRALFSWCTTLEKAPALPATTLATGCYWYLFEECALTEAPVLPATTLVNECYGNMFLNNHSLSYIKCLATDGFSATNCKQNWVSGVAATGTFVKAVGVTWTTGVAGIPTGWTVYEDGYEPTPQAGEWYYNNQLVDLPYSVNGLDGHTSGYYKGTSSFLSIFEIDTIQPTYLWFDHADQSAEIYVNNTLVTTHWGGYNSFTVDISSFIQVGTNRLQVILNNTTRNTLAPADGDFNFNATLGAVELITGAVLPTTEYGYDGFRITSSITPGGSATVTVTTAVTSSCRAVLEISDGTYTYSDTQTGDGTLTFTATIASPVLWHGKRNPHLYNVTLSLYDGQDLCFTATRPYGLRYFSYGTVTVGNETYTGFLLNGEPYELRGVCMHQDLEDVANALTVTDINNDFAVIQELGCNFIRTAHYPHPRAFYDKCDELGIVVQTEVPWVKKAQSTMPSDYYTHLSSQIVDMVTQHYNHPSILFWGLANEISSDDAAFAKTKIEGYRTLIRTYDTSRWVGYVVSHSYPDGLGVFNVPDVDYIGQNLYVGWYIDQNTNDPTTRINTCLGYANNRNKPMALSEYGCGGTQHCHSEDPQTTTTKGNNPRHDIEYQMWLHEGHIAAIKTFPQLLFTAQWVLFDFAVSSRQEGYTICLDGTNTSTDNNLKYLNDKGLLERDHTTKKDTFYLYKAWWNPTSKFVHICGKDFVKSTSRIIKCYTNDGDTLTMSINNEAVTTAAVTNNIATFTARTFSSGDVVVISGDTTNDTLTF